MVKPLQIACLAGTGLLVLGAFIVVGRGEAASARQQQSPAPAAAAIPSQASPEAIDASNTQEVLALQQAKTDSRAAAAAKDAGWIGVMLESEKTGGLRVKEVFPGGPAAFAGLRVGDVLLKIGDKRPKSEADVASAIEHLAPKQQATLTVQRGKQTLVLDVPVESLAEFNAHYVSEMMRRDPRDPHFAEHHGVSAADMNVELVRRLFEQNQRQETLLHQIREELKELRAEVHGKSK